jgi:hypothetical protein
LGVSLFTSLFGLKEGFGLDGSAGHSVHRVLVCALSGFSTLFASDGSSTNFQVSQTHTQVWDLVFRFFTGSCWFF